MASTVVHLSIGSSRIKISGGSIGAVVFLEVVRAYIQHIDPDINLDLGGVVATGVISSVGAVSSTAILH